MTHQTLEHARERAQQARDRLRAAPVNSGAHMDAESSLRYWEARAAVLAAGGHASVKAGSSYVRNRGRA